MLLINIVLQNMTILGRCPSPKKQVRLRVIHEGRTARWEVTEICMKFASRAVLFKIEPQNSIRFRGLQVSKLQFRSYFCFNDRRNGSENKEKMQREDSLFPFCLFLI